MPAASRGPNLAAERFVATSITIRDTEKPCAPELRPPTAQRGNLRDVVCPGTPRTCLPRTSGVPPPPRPPLLAQLYRLGDTVKQREARLGRIVGQARFLILPWVRCRNLASRLLSQSSRQLPRDWQVRYGIRPLLLESFVDRTRFPGTCYRAANWILVGRTRGRGKKDRARRRELPVKDIWLYPLDRHAQERLRH